MKTETGRRKTRTPRVLLAVAALAMVPIAGAPAPLQAGQSGAKPAMPVFEVDPAWPQKLPYNWIVGHVASVAIDSRDHVLVLHRPNTIPPEDRARAAPPVIEFDAAGKFVTAWGGPGVPGYDWPDSEHGIAIDYKNSVWIGGSAPVAPSLRTLNDDMLLKFTLQGKFLMQIGGRDKSGGNKDTKSVHQSADVFVWPKTNEAFVADGYGNRRVIVFDADTGAFKRMWGAFGNEPIDVARPTPAPAAAATGEPPARGARGTAPAAPAQAAGRGAAPRLDTEGPGSPQFGSPTHSVKVSNDGLVYVADRPNRRVQVFTPDGKYVTQMFLNRAGPSNGSAAGVAFSPDSEQRFLYVADYGNSHIAVVDRKTLQVLYQFGQRSAKPGDFQGLHHMAVDSKGNLYTGEVAPGARMQKFLFKGMSPTLPANALTPAQLNPAPPPPAH
jgi:DNA-binding beta-propeller fold protein YncE